MKVELLKYPTAEDWMEVKRRALVTIGKAPVSPPDDEWKRAILRARHSPIRYLTFSFLIECPYWVANHLVRHHVGAQPYVRSQRNDRQDEYDREKAPQDAPVVMILDLNAEALITLANKRLCAQASARTQELVGRMCLLAEGSCPEIKDELVPMCERNGGVCHELNPCGYCAGGVRVCLCWLHSYRGSCSRWVSEPEPLSARGSVWCS